MKSWIVLALAVATGSVAVATEKQPPKASLKLVVNLRDGSRLIGMTDLASLPVQTEALGRIEIPLEKIRTVKFSADHGSVTVSLGNGDRVQGRLGRDDCLRLII